MQEESLTGHRDKQVQRPRGRPSTSEEQQKAGAATGRGVGGARAGRKRPGARASWVRDFDLFSA